MNNRLNSKIWNGVRDWEILQKNFAQHQMEQLYYSYKTLISVIVGLMVLSLVFLVMYLYASKNHKENSAFTRQMIQTQEAERERISNELHDTVCQDLRVLQFRLEDEDTIELCKKIASDVRNTCYALTPSDLSEGLLEALISLCALFRNKTSINLILSIQDDIKENPAFKTFSKEKNLSIYRVVQEILTNAAKHSESETVSVLVRSFDENNFRIIISDEGKVFDLKSVLKKKNHFGLKNIQTRVEKLHGAVNFYSEADAGTQVTVTLPYKSFPAG